MADHWGEQLVESSPLAILTVNNKGEILSANRSAHQLFGFDDHLTEGADAPCPSSTSSLTSRRRPVVCGHWFGLLAGGETGKDSWLNCGCRHTRRWLDQNLQQSSGTPLKTFAPV